MKDRPYQTELHAAIREAIREGHRSIVVYAPTGAGKTNIGGRIMKNAEAKGNPSCFLAPRRDLVYQTVSRLEQFGVKAGMIMAGEATAKARLCQVASFDTLHSWVTKRQKMELPPAKVVLPDEAHLSLTETRETLIRAFGEEALVIALTATPARGDGKPLKNLYTKLVKGPTEASLIRDGYLVGFRYYGPSQPDRKLLKVRRGDYTDSSSVKVMNTPQLVGEIITHWRRLSNDKPTVCYCVNKAHARAVCAEFLEQGISAELVLDETKDRLPIYARVASGETKVLVNVFVASYGLDIPVLTHIILARPTKSLTMLRQMLGRCARPIYAAWADADMLEESADIRLAAIADSDKPYATVQDHTGSIEDIGYFEDEVPWTLEGDEDVAEVMKRERGERAEPKPLNCPACKHIFKGTKFCPACGFELIAPGKPIPTHKADLVELDREKVTDGNAANRKTPWPEKAAFMGQAKTYAAMKGFKDGYAANMYRDKFGVWPNDPRVRDAAPQPVDALLKGFIQHRAMKKKFSKVVA